MLLIYTSKLKIALMFMMVIVFAGIHLSFQHLRLFVSHSLSFDHLYVNASVVAFNINDFLRIVHYILYRIALYFGDWRLEIKITIIKTVIINNSQLSVYACAEQLHKIASSDNE